MELVKLKYKCAEGGRAVARGAEPMRMEEFTTALVKLERSRILMGYDGYIREYLAGEIKIDTTSKRGWKRVEC